MNIKLTSTAPVNGSNDVQRVTIGGTPDGTGYFQLVINGVATAHIVWSATNGTLLAHIQTALNNLIGTNNAVAADVSLSSGIGVFSITFQNLFGSQLQQAITCVNALGGTAPTLTPAHTTPGVTATYHNSSKGQFLVHNTPDPPATYQNISSSVFNPNWVAYPDTSNLP